MRSTRDVLLVSFPRSRLPEESNKLGGEADLKYSFYTAKKTTQAILAVQRRTQVNGRILT